MLLIDANSELRNVSVPRWEQTLAGARSAVVLPSI